MEKNPPTQFLLLRLVFLSLLAFSASASSVDDDSDSDSAIISRFQQYLQINTAQPIPDYSQSTSFLLSLAKALALESETLEFAAGKPLLLLKWPGKDPSLPSILLNSHTDVVPAEPAKWTHPPFSGHLDGDGRIHARGSQDMKCVGMQYLEAIRRLKSSGFQPIRTVYLSFVPDEEIGGLDGVGLFTESDRFKEMNVGIVLDEGLASTNEKYRMFYAERCPWWLVIKAVGAPGHGSKLYDNSAMENLMKSIEIVRRFRASQFDMVKAGLKAEGEVISVNMVFLKAGTPSPTVRIFYVLLVYALKARSHILWMIDICRLGVSSNGFSSTSSLQLFIEMCSSLDYFTENRFGKWVSIESSYLLFELKGFVMNLQPSEVEAGFDVRVPPNANEQSLEKRIAEEWAPSSRNMSFMDEIQDCTLKQKVSVLDMFGKPTLTMTDSSNPWWTLLHEAVTKVGGKLNEPEIFPASTDSRYFRERGLPAIGFSPMANTPILLHDHNERTPTTVTKLRKAAVKQQRSATEKAYIEMAGKSTHFPLLLLLLSILTFAPIPAIPPNPPLSPDYPIHLLPPLPRQNSSPEFTPGKPLVILKWPGKDLTLPSILLDSHTDVVPAESAKWAHPPFSAHIGSEGRIYARGSQDMECVGMQYLEAIRHLKSSGFEPIRTVYLSFVADEEISSQAGMESFVASEKFVGMNVGVVLDEGLASTDSKYRAFYAERCPWWLVIRAVGAPGHGSKLYDNNAAIVNLMKSIESVRQFHRSQSDIVKAGLKTFKI
ncbi:hypothetical protein ACLOJK_021243 [Asimina triloba]